MKVEQFGTPESEMYIVLDGEFITGWYEKEKAETMYTARQQTHQDQLSAPYNPRLGESDLTIEVHQPMLIVGANNYLRSKLPFFVMQKYNVALFFMPTSEPYWKVGAILVNRTADVKPCFVYCENKSIIEALKYLFIGITIEAMKDKHVHVNPKLLMWTENWIYRCPKISLKDITHLESYKESA